MKKLLLAGVLLASGCFAVVEFPPVTLGVGVPVTVHWEVIPGTVIYYSTDLGFEVFFYRGRYYRVINGVWYVAASWRGPWRIVRVVPDVFLWIPPAHPAYRVVIYHPHYHRYRVYTAPPASGRPAKGKKGRDERHSGGGTWIRR